MAKKNSEADKSANSKASGTSAKKSKAAKEPKVKKKRFARTREIWQAYQLLKQSDRGLGLWIIGSGVLAFLAGFGLLVWLGGFGALNVVLAVLSGLLLGILTGLIVFAIRARKTTYAQAEGRPGAASWAMDQMRGDWRVTQAVAVNTQQDMVHRVIGRPGLILVAEGDPKRLSQMIATEKKRLSRVVGDTPIYIVTVGDGDDQVTLKKLNKHIMKLPRNVQGAQIRALDKRLQAVGQPKVPLPKGPMPQGRQLAVSNRQMRRKGMG